jgi:glucose-1-phosphatase
MPSPAVFFDLGNVLVRLDIERGVARLKALAGERAPAELGAAQLYFSEAALAFNRGELTSDAYLDQLARLLGFPSLPRGPLADAWCAIFEPYPEMEATAGEVLALGHRAYLASNTDPLHLGYLRPRLPLLARLTGLHLSYEARAAKPDPAFFRAALDRFGVEPAACAYLDDRPEHVAAAQGLGIASHLHDFAAGAAGVAAARAFLRRQGVALP